MRQKKQGKAFFAKYMTRNQALRKLQLSLPAFRRLCILKGIYPREPHKKPKGANKTFYYAKDINFLLHEPLIETFRQEKVHRRKLTKAAAKKDYTELRHLLENRPEGSLHHIIKERYPTFVDAVRELDDSLCMEFLFSQLPQTKFVSAELVTSAKRNVLEFQNYVVHHKALRKVFLSIKGIYYQAEVFGQPVTWVVPYQFSQELTGEVDFRVMRTFLEFYDTLLKFVNFKLYHSLGLKYPPELNKRLEAAGAQLGALDADPAPAILPARAQDRVPKSTDEMSKRISELKVRMAGAEVAALPPEPTAADMDEVKLDEFTEERAEGEEPVMAQPSEDEAKERLASLFKHCRFWLSREVPVPSLEFVIRSFGGTLSWEADPVAPFAHNDETITHQIGDRPTVGHRFLSRQYVQPQWVYDSVNAGIQLPVEWYTPGHTLPPHLSPFEEYKEGDYVPEQHTIIERLKNTAAAHPAEDEEDDTDGDGAVDAEAVQETLESRYAGDLALEMKGVTFSASLTKKGEEPKVGAKRKRAAPPKGAETTGEGDEDEAKAEAEAEASEEESSEGAKKAPAEEVEDDDSERMNKAMMGRRQARLYSRIKFGQAKKKEAVEKLDRKRRKLANAVQ